MEVVERGKTLKSLGERSASENPAATLPAQITSNVVPRCTHHRSRGVEEAAPTSQQLRHRIWCLFKLKNGQCIPVSRNPPAAAKSTPSLETHSLSAPTTHHPPPHTTSSLDTCTPPTTHLTQHNSHKTLSPTTSPE